MPTGWKAPYTEGVFLLVVKSKGDEEACVPRINPELSLGFSDEGLKY